jgi:hypothetical protein
MQLLRPVEARQGTSEQRALASRMSNNTEATCPRMPCTSAGPKPPPSGIPVGFLAAAFAVASSLSHSSSLLQPSFLQQPPPWQPCASSQARLPKLQRLSRSFKLHCNLRPINISHDAVLICFLLLLEQGGHTLNQTLRLISINRVARHTRLKHRNGGLANT